MGNASEAAENNLPFVLRRFLGIRTQRWLRTPLFYSRYFFRESEKWSECISPLPPSLHVGVCVLRRRGGGEKCRDAPRERERDKTK